MKSFFNVSSSRSLRSVAAGLVLGTCAVSTAQADVTFCNKINAPLFVSVAYNENGEWISQGWEKIDPGSCRADPFELHVSQFFFRAETDWINVAGGRKVQHTWADADGVRLSVVNPSFTFHHADVQQRGSRLAAFSSSIRTETGEVSETITFNEDSTSQSWHRTGS
jgi:uncharacterized membrane protein